MCVDSSNVSWPSPRPTDGGDSALSSPLCAMDVDSMEALEKYVPDWSVADKDRVVDALSAKI
ncbi:hypothetical protein Hanom_Chr05g00422731 [Helianthus anomalus]